MNFSFSQIKNIQFTEYEYFNSNCNGYKYNTGTFFYVPENAFCFDDGTSCKEKITIKYREFHTQVDMLVAGINMIAKLNGKDAILESVGMFEIKAECKGKPVNLCNGKSIQVRMKCNRNLPNIAAYKYDEKLNWWNYNGQVYDFSFDNKKPYEEPNRWGNGPINGIDSVDAIRVDSMGNEVMVRSIASGYINNPITEGIFKAMNVQSMGIYNYDCVINDKDAVPMIPEFVLNNGEPVVEQIYVAYESRNTLVNYYKDDLSERFVLLNIKGIKIFTILNDGSYAVLKPGSLDNLNLLAMKGTKQKFILEKKPKLPKTKEDVSKLAGISNR
jgi:hypothetical protein